MVLVTGGSGFIGQAIAQTLLARGNRVRIFDVLPPPPSLTKAEFFMGDITDAEAVMESVKGVETVYHCVALVPLSKSGDNFWRVNVDGTATLLHACRAANVKRFVHISSSAVFGIPVCPVTNQTELRPVEIYGRAKLAGENLVKQYMLEGRHAAIIRPRTVIGTNRLGIFQILFEWISENRDIYIIGDGSNLFQFVDIDDLVNACVLSAEMEMAGIYNIGTDRFSTLKADLTTFIATVGSKTRIKSVSPRLAISALKLLDALKLSPLAPWHYLTYHKPFYFDVSNEKRTLNWQPVYGNVDMLTKSYNWYVNSREEEPGRGDVSVHKKAPQQKLLKLLKWIS